ncbi:MAG: SIMPL domain-containing protein [Muribaculaceae bacterium]|nr:SIMPL domain-containing protein [Muribaculaceae bacterium]
MDKSKVIAGALVAVGLLLLGICIKGGIDNFANKGRQVTVRGLSERTVDANLVTWPIVTKEVGNNLPAIYNRIQSTNSRIVNFLESNGLSKTEFAVNAPQVEDRQAQGYNPREVTDRYLVTNVIVVSSEKVDLVRKLIEKVPELMQEGIAVVDGDYQYRTRYEFTGLNEIKPEMITEATQAARQAAERFAADSQSDIGKIITASQGQFSIDDRDQYTPYVKTVRVVTYITYELKN